MLFNRQIIEGGLKRVKEIIHKTATPIPNLQAARLTLEKIAENRLHLKTASDCTIFIPTGMSFAADWLKIFG